MGLGAVAGDSLDGEFHDAAGAVVHGRDGLAQAAVLLGTQVHAHDLLHVVQQAGVNHTQRAVQALLAGLENDL